MGSAKIELLFCLGTKTRPVERQWVHRKCLWNVWTERRPHWVPNFLVSQGHTGWSYLGEHSSGGAMWAGMRGPLKMLRDGNWWQCSGVALSLPPLHYLSFLDDKGTFRVASANTKSFQVCIGKLGQSVKWRGRWVFMFVIKAKLSPHFSATPRVTCPSSRRRAWPLTNRWPFTGDGLRVKCFVTFSQYPSGLLCQTNILSKQIRIVSNSSWDLPKGPDWWVGSWHVSPQNLVYAWKTGFHQSDI